MGREFVHTCNNCKSHVETRYHCTVCEDFDLCVSCKDKNGHPHPMKKVRKLSIQRSIQSLVHACQCRDANCHLPSCCKMKRVIMHTKNCKRKTNGGCRICKQLITLCCYHAKHCQETKCLVPFCFNIKHKIKQQQLQQRLQQTQLLRRMAVMNMRPSGPMAMRTGQHTSNVAMGTGVAMKPGVSTSNLPSPYQPGIGLKPGTQTPPAHMLQVVKQVQEEAARQQAPHVNYGKVTPGCGVGVGVSVGVGVVGQTSGVMPPPQMQRPLPVQMPNPGTHLIPMDQWTARYQSNTVMQQNPNLARQQTLQQMQQPHQAQPGMAITAQMPRQPGVIGGQVGPQASNMQKHALQQLMQTLRSPQTPKQQNQILKSHPPLMAAFIKPRIVHRQQPGQHGGGVGGPLAPNQLQQQPGLQYMMSQQQQPQQQQQQQGRLQAMLSQWYKQQMPAMQQRQQQAAQQQQQQQQQQQLQQRLQQAQLLRRRIAVMNMRPSGPMTR